MLLRVDAGLSASSSLFDTHLRHTGFDSLSHTAKRFDFLDVFPSLVSDFVGEGFYIVRTAPWVDFATDFSLLLDVNLSVTSDTSREIGRKSDCFVERVGVK